MTTMTRYYVIYPLNARGEYGRGRIIPSDHKNGPEGEWMDRLTPANGAGKTFPFAQSRPFESAELARVHLGNTLESR